MAFIKEDQLNQVLRSLNQSTPDIEGAAIISMDGLVMASSLPATMEEDRISAMSAALFGIGARSAVELQRGDVEEIYVKGKEGYMLVTKCGADAVLTVIADARAKLGIIFLDVHRAAAELAKII